ncbi:MAG: invasin domain 3-containing protein, partial [Myxococcota bacterium]
MHKQTHFIAPRRLVWGLLATSLLALSGLGCSGDAGLLPATDDAGAGAEQNTSPDGAAQIVQIAPQGAPLGAACHTAEECESAFCAPSAMGGLCSTPCGAEGCQPGWFCEPSPWLEETEGFCLPAHTLGCRACSEDAECGSDAGRCVAVGGGAQTYCASTCQDGLPCPSGYGCGQLETDGEWLCLPDAGRCVCTGNDEGLARQCASTNDHGTCLGVEVCAGPDGWTSCDAPEPAAEACNGADDNCNGLIDEGYPDTDQDSLKDCVDDDDDGDGIADADDNCPLTPNPGQEDSGGDPAGDACDAASVCGDGVCGADETDCPADCPPPLDDAGSSTSDASSDAGPPAQEDAAADVGPSPDTGGVDAADDGDAEAPSDDTLLSDAEGPVGDTSAVGEDAEGPVDDASLSDVDEATVDTSLPDEDAGEPIDDTSTPEEDTEAPADDTAEPESDVEEPEPFEPFDPIALPYTEDFDAAVSFAEVGWTQWSAAEDNGLWILSLAGDLGEDSHPRFIHDGFATATQHQLISPPLNAEGAAFVTLRFEQAVVAGKSAGGVTLRVLASPDGQAPWSEAWSQALDADAPPHGSVVVDMSGALAGMSSAAIAFEVEASDAEAFIYWDIDTVEVLAAAAPTIAPVSDVTLLAGELFEFGVSVEDADTAAETLSWSLVGAPDFVTLTVDGLGIPTVRVAPDIGDAGTFEVTVQVTDGLFTDAADFTVVVEAVEVPEVGSLTYLVIRDAAGGAGDPVGSKTLELDQSLALFAAGYDSDMVYLEDVSVLWSVTGTLDALQGLDGPQASATFTALTPGSSGTIRVDHLNSSVAGDETGLISVPFPEGGPFSDATSTVHTSQSVIEADGIDSATVVVTLRDAYGTLLTTDHAVSLQTTAGELLGEVVHQPNGTWTQTLRASDVAGLATISANVDGTPLSDDAVVEMIDVENTMDSGTFTIDCTNSSDYTGETVVVDGATLVIDVTDCAPLDLNHLIVNSGTVTHSAAADGQSRGLNLRADSIFVDTGATITGSGKGYPSKTWWNWQSRELANTMAGSHGGFGARGNAPNSEYSVNPVYGNLYAPQTM